MWCSPPSTTPPTLGASKSSASKCKAVSDHMTAACAFVQHLKTTDFSHHSNAKKICTIFCELCFTTQYDYVSRIFHPCFFPLVT
jgi:hypothetical protein